jgi:hypothetical protein
MVKNAHRYAGDFWQSTKEVDANSVLKMKMASGGGWVARIIEK